MYRGSSRNGSISGSDHDDAESRILDPPRNPEPAERLVAVSELGVDFRVLVRGGFTQTFQGCREPSARLLGASELRIRNCNTRQALPLDLLLVELGPGFFEIAGFQQHGSNAPMHAGVVRIQALRAPRHGKRLVVAPRPVVRIGERDVLARREGVELHGLRASLDGLVGQADPERESGIEALDFRAARVERERPLKLRLGPRNVEIDGGSDVCERQPGFGQRRFEFYGVLRRLACAPEARIERLVSVRRQVAEDTGAARMGPRVSRILGDGLIECR